LTVATWIPAFAGMTKWGVRNDGPNAVVPAKAVTHFGSTTSAAGRLITR
jgi:hypothetical protein